MFIREKDKVLAIKEGGLEPVYALETTTGNYIAWGYASSNSIYQQRPTPAGGVVFKKDHFRYFDHAPDETGALILVLRDPKDPDAVRYIPAEQCIWFQTIDTALTVTKNSAYTAAITFALTPRSDLLVWHVWRKKLEVPDQFDALMDLRSRSEIRLNGAEQGDPWPHPLAFQAVEEKASGIGLIQQGAARGRPFRKLNADKDKVSRAATAATWYQNGKIWHRQAAPWLTIFEDELLCFPAGTYKDLGDCLAHGAIVANETEFNRLSNDHDLLVWPPLPGSDLGLPGYDEENIVRIGDIEVDFHEPRFGED